MTIWYPKSKPPKYSRWYITSSLDNPSHSIPRYFDNTTPPNISWYIARDNGGSDSIHEDNDCEDPLIVNMSFDMWCEMPILKVGG